jgi:hypothetical protein
MELYISIKMENLLKLEKVLLLLNIADKITSKNNDRYTELMSASHRIIS